MFWSAVGGGFAILRYWEVWLAALIYLVGIVAFMASANAMMGGDEASGPRPAGCLFFMVGGPIVQGVLMALMVAFLLPIMLGGDDAAPVAFLATHIGPIALAGVIAIVVGIVLSLVPIVGGFIANAPGLLTFIEGVVIFRLMSSSLLAEVLANTEVQGSIYPGFWESDWISGYRWCSGIWRDGAPLYFRDYFGRNRQEHYVFDGARTGNRGWHAPGLHVQLLCCKVGQGAFGHVTGRATS